MKPITIIEHTGDGNGVKIDNLGFAGNACEKATRAIEDALGGGVSDRKHKPEYNRTASIKAGNTQKA